MDDYVEVWTAGTPSVIALTGDEITVGRADSNDIVISSDDMVSRLHALLTRDGSGWRIRDLGSSNGTTVNGKPVLEHAQLASGDEIAVGDSRMVFHSSEDGTISGETHPNAPPAMSHREREVLLALCEPILSAMAPDEEGSRQSGQSGHSGSETPPGRPGRSRRSGRSAPSEVSGPSGTPKNLRPGVQPASIRTISAQLVIGEEAVTFHLTNLCEKFGIPATDRTQRRDLALEAVRRGAVTRSDLGPHSDWSNRTSM